MAEFDLNCGTGRSIRLTVCKPVSDVQAAANPAVAIALHAVLIEQSALPDRAIRMLHRQSAFDSSRHLWRQFEEYIGDPCVIRTTNVLRHPSLGFVRAISCAVAFSSPVPCPSTVGSHLNPMGFGAVQRGRANWESGPHAGFICLGPLTTPDSAE